MIATFGSPFATELAEFLQSRWTCGYRYGERQVYRLASFDRFVSRALRKGQAASLATLVPAWLLSWLGLPTAELVGTISARDLAARCRRRLWPEARNVDAEVPEEVDHRFVCFGRPGGYLRQRTQELLELADLAGDGLIFWA